MHQAHHLGSWESVSSSSSKAQRASDSTPDLPVVDVSPLLRGGRRARHRVADALGQAAEEFGFFYLAGHGIEQAHIDAVYAQAASWFARSLEEKRAYYIGT